MARAPCNAAAIRCSTYFALYSSSALSEPFRVVPLAALKVTHMATDDEKKAAALRRKRNAAFSARLERAKKRTFRPYGIALSYLVFNWNRLHEALSLLFIMVVNAPNSKNHLGTADRAVPLAIWHSMRSDSSQRDMLRAATTVAPHLTDRQRADIKWMLQEIDKSLRGDRNSAIHAPLTFSAREIADGSEFAMNANIFSGSRHAKKIGWEKSN